MVTATIYHATPEQTDSTPDITASNKKIDLSNPLKHRWIAVSRDLEEKAKGLAAKAYVKDLLENSDNGKFSIISHGTGKYGRVLGELFVKGHEKSVNELLKENGHAYEYHGEKKKVFGS